MAKIIHFPKVSRPVMGYPPWSVSCADCALLESCRIPYVAPCPPEAASLSGDPQ